MKQGRPPHFIAEVSSNHHRDLARCFEFIDTAARIGCDAVKFQLFKIDQLFAPEILATVSMLQPPAYQNLQSGQLS